VKSQQARLLARERYFSIDITGASRLFPKRILTKLCVVPEDIRYLSILDTYHDHAWCMISSSFSSFSYRNIPYFVQCAVMLMSSVLSRPENVCFSTFYDFCKPSRLHGLRVFMPSPDSGPYYDILKLADVADVFVANSIAQGVASDTLNILISIIITTSSALLECDSSYTRDI